MGGGEGQPSAVMPDPPSLIKVRSEPFSLAQLAPRDRGRVPVAGRKWPGPFHLTPLRLQTNYPEPPRAPIIHSRERAIFIIDWWR